MWSEDQRQTKELMVAWINHDTTGSHPETYHDISDQLGLVTTFLERGLRHFITDELRTLDHE
jgi:hypothetical protein